MSELSFEQMFEESSFKRLRTGEAVTGQVIGVKEDEIILSIAGSKSSESKRRRGHGCFIIQVSGC